VAPGSALPGAFRALPPVSDTRRSGLFFRTSGTVPQSAPSRDRVRTLAVAHAQGKNLSVYTFSVNWLPPVQYHIMLCPVLIEKRVSHDCPDARR